MPFDITTRTLLQYYTDHPPRTEDVWYGPSWSAIFTTLFPPSQGSAAPHSRGRIPGFLIEVARISTPPLTLRTVLIVDVKNSPLWEPGKGALMRQIGLQTDMTFEGTATEKVYWIGMIGPQWIDLVIDRFDRFFSATLLQLVIHIYTAQHVYKPP